MRAFECGTPRGEPPDRDRHVARGRGAPAHQSGAHDPERASRSGADLPTLRALRDPEHRRGHRLATAGESDRMDLPDHRLAAERSRSRIRALRPRDVSRSSSRRGLGGHVVRGSGTGFQLPSGPRDPALPDREAAVETLAAHPASAGRLCFRFRAACLLANRLAQLRDRKSPWGAWIRRCGRARWSGRSAAHPVRRLHGGGSPATASARARCRAAAAQVAHRRGELVPRFAAASRMGSTGASIARATTRRARSTRSRCACATRSTSTRSAASSSPPSATRCSPRTRACGCGAGSDERRRTKVTSGKKPRLRSDAVDRTVESASASVSLREQAR